MKVGILTASVSRQGGGVAAAVRSLSSQLKQAECAIHVFSIADRFSVDDRIQWGDMDMHVVARRGPDAFRYAPGLSGALDRAGLDLVHTHGLWMYPSLAALRWSRRWGRPLVVSPHGMLDPWAVRNSAWKKRLAGMLFEHAHLRRAACLHALCESEYRSLRGYGLANPVAVIPNGVELPELDRARTQPNWAEGLPAGSRILLFLGRIHPKKGLTVLLDAFARFRKESTSVSESWRLVIAGWDQGGYQETLQRQSNALGLSQSVLFVGPQFGDQKAASLTRADAFILPSVSEGLPMAILEAWSYRLPVLMTPQCNLPEGFRAGAGIEMAPQAADIFAALTKLSAMSESERFAMGENGRRLVAERFSWPQVAAQMRGVYAWVLGRGERPDCVLSD